MGSKLAYLPEVISSIVFLADFLEVLFLLLPDPLKRNCR